MIFQRYPQYKASGVEWLGDVPEGWDVCPLKTIASGVGALFIDGDWIESKDISSAGIRYLTSGNVGEGIYKEQGQGFITDGTFNALNCVEVIPGDVLISRLNLPIGRACIVPDLGSRIVTCVDNVIVRPSPLFNTRFCVYLLSCKAHFENMEILGRGATMPRISRSVLGRIQFAFPPLPEQTAIAEFLDRETGKIDGLVAEQRRLMELLKEKRQAVISHAVTKGLNPHAPVKPSGIEWLGDVPEHWEVTRLGFLCFKIGSGKTPSGGGEAYLSEGITFIRSQNVCDDGLRLDDVVYVSEETDAEQSWSRVLPGDILLNITGASLGRTCLVPSVFDRANVNQHVCILRLTSALSRTFIAMVLKSSGMKSQFDSAQNGAAREGLNFAQISKLALALPPQSEQDAIVRHLDTELAKFDTLSVEAQCAIDLLQERRTALISAAVTGQIDVRQQPRN